MKDTHTLETASLRVAMNWTYFISCSYLLRLSSYFSPFPEFFYLPNCHPTFSYVSSYLLIISSACPVFSVSLYMMPPLIALRNLASCSLLLFRTFNSATCYLNLSLSLSRRFTLYQQRNSSTWTGMVFNVVARLYVFTGFMLAISPFTLASSD